MSVEGRLVAKTGSLENQPVTADPPSVKALSGYLPVAERRRDRLRVHPEFARHRARGKYQAAVGRARRAARHLSGGDLSLAELSPR